MNTILRRIACATALLAATAANATTYNFSYTFSDNGFADASTVTGSFDGTASGNLITGLTNISVFRNNVQFGTGNLYSFRFNNDGIGAVASFDGLENDFLFSTSQFQMGGGYFYGNAFGISSAWSQAYVQGGSGYARGDNFSAARWSVTAVPEPATYAMLLGGLGLVGAMARRRRAV